MSHLIPHRTARITPGGAAVTGTNHAVAQPVEHDTSWDGLIVDLAAALGLEPGVAAQFTTHVDAVAESLALIAAIDLDVARTKIRGAILGEHAMVTDTIPVHLTPQAVDELLTTWDITAPDEADRVLARLSLLYTDLVEPVPDPTGNGDTVGEGDAGSGAPLPETAPEEIPGVLAYTLDSVPTNARDVVTWISDAVDDDDRRARADAAFEVENQRDGDPRSTVTAAIDTALGG